MFKKRLIILISLILLTGCQTPPEETVVAFDEQNQLITANYDNTESQATINKALTDKKKTINIFKVKNKITLQTFEKPMGITFDKDDNFYILDQSKNKLFKFNNKGDYLEEWGDKGKTLGEFDEPKYIITNKNGNLVISDTWNQRIQIIGLDGVPIKAIEGDFFGPKGIAEYDNKLFIADTGHHVIKLIDYEGKVLKELGSKDSAEFTLNEPTGLTIDDKGNLYIVDSKNNRIVKLNKSLQFVKEWHVKGWEELDQGKESWLGYNKGKLYLSDPKNTNVRVYDLNGNESKPIAENLDGVSGITIHKDKLYIVEFIGKQVKIIDLNKG